MNKKKIVILTFIILFLILVVCFIGLSVLKNNRNSKENLAYINSDELDEGTVSPEMIHVVIALYEGELNPKAISKSTYHFINHLVPEYVKKCTDENVARKYFQYNKENINLDIGINDENSFVNLINELTKLSGNLKFESSRFDKDTIKRKNDYTEADLYIKYQNNNEIAVHIKVLNKICSNKSTIIFEAIK